MHLIPSLAALAALSSLVYGQNRVCNNAAALCGRSYGNITHLGAHDSFTTRSAENSYSVAADQFYNILQQLDAGVRLVTAQVHKSDGGNGLSNVGSGIGTGAMAESTAAVSSVGFAFGDVGSTLGSTFGGDRRRQATQDFQNWRLCHSNCLLYDGGSLIDWLSGISGWLDKHPNDVVTLLLVNSDNADAPTFKNIFEASGAGKYAYAPADLHTAPQNWPTLNQLIDQGKRLMVFIANLEQNTVAPYLMNEFNFVFENNYDNVQPTDFSCQPNRPSTLANNIPLALGQNYLPFMNHFLYDKINGDIEIPSVNRVQTTNGATGLGSLGDAANACTQQWNRAPAFILVDFFNVADPIAVVDRLNGVAGNTTGRLLVPDTVDAATALPYPTSMQTPTATQGPSVVAITDSAESVSGRSIATPAAPTTPSTTPSISSSSASMIVGNIALSFFAAAVSSLGTLLAVVDV